MYTQFISLCLNSVLRINLSRDVQWEEHCLQTFITYHNTLVLKTIDTIHHTLVNAKLCSATSSFTKIKYHKYFVFLNKN